MCKHLRLDLARLFITLDSIIELLLLVGCRTMKAPERIQTERLVLRRYRLTDTTEIFEGYAQDIEGTKFLTWRPQQSIEETNAFVKDRIDAWAVGDDFNWAVTLNDGRLMGGIGLQIIGFKADKVKTSY